MENEIDNHRTDHTQFPARTQELPAVYTNGPWYRILTYEGDRPFTGLPVDEVPHDFPWHSYQATECWTALVDKNDDGLGVWAPGTQGFSAGFAGQPGAGGSKESPTGYIAPNKDEILDWNVRFQSRYTLILGSLKQIRAYVYAHSKPSLPRWRFSKDRQDWRYVNASDTGLPIQGELNVKLEQNDPQLIGPVGCWAAADTPVLTVEAACRLHDPNAQIFWSSLGTRVFSEARSLHFLLRPDGNYHTYHIRLSNSSAYNGTITQLRFDPEPDGAQGDFVRVRSMALTRG